jgi:hypothetical protein
MQYLQRFEGSGSALADMVGPSAGGLAVGSPGSRFLMHGFGGAGPDAGTHGDGGNGSQLLFGGLGGLAGLGSTGNLQSLLGGDVAQMNSPDGCLFADVLPPLSRRVGGGGGLQEGGLGLGRAFGSMGLLRGLGSSGFLAGGEEEAEGMGGLEDDPQEAVPHRSSATGEPPGS